MTAASDKQLGLVGIRYIGLKPKKNENITGTDTVWNGFGDIQKVPIAVAQRLLQPKYNKIWQNEADDPPADATDAARSAEAAKSARTAVAARKAELDRKTPPERERAFDLVPVDRIQSAIGDLAEKDVKGEHFLPSGLPRLESVQAELGKRISQPALTEAWDLIKSAQARG